MIRIFDSWHQRKLMLILVRYQKYNVNVIPHQPTLGRVVINLVLETYADIRFHRLRENDPESTLKSVDQAIRAGLVTTQFAARVCAMNRSEIEFLYGRAK
jgi:phosphohistidine phosphatase SixA